MTDRDAFEAWAERDHRDLSPLEFEERTPDNNHYYATNSTNEAYIGWCAAHAEAARLTHLLSVRDRQARATSKFWVRAAKAALAGDVRELRNRVELAEAEPLDVVLSEDK